MKTVLIYGLAHPDTGAIRYVGKTLLSRVKYRMADHMKAAHVKGSHYPVHCWMRSLGVVQPTVITLEETTEGEWREAERRWIVQGREQGWKLLNVQEGGQGGYHPGNGWNEAAWSAAREALARLSKEERSARARKAMETRRDRASQKV